jgi:hypothetical protein
MRYVLADLTGRSHAYFDSRAEAREAILEIYEDDPSDVEELYLVGYGDDGARQWGPRSASDVRNALDWSGEESGQDAEDIDLRSDGGDNVVNQSITLVGAGN